MDNYAHKQYAGFQPIDFNRPQKKRIKTNNYDTKRVLNPNLLDKPKIFQRNLSEVRFRNNGTWNSLMSRTKKEDSLIGKVHRANPRLFSSEVFTKPIIKYNNVNLTLNDNNNKSTYNINGNINILYNNNRINNNSIHHNNLKEKFHRKIAPYSDYSKTSAIYSLPGCVKRSDFLIKDDKKNYNNRINYASLYKNNRDYGPLELKKDNINDNNKSIFLGGYGCKYKNQSTVFDNRVIEDNNNKFNENKNRLFNIFNKDHVLLC
jgi:hypothetical protein